MPTNGILVSGMQQFKEQGKFTSFPMAARTQVQTLAIPKSSLLSLTLTSQEGISHITSIQNNYI